MNTQEFKATFEDHYVGKITKDGMKQIYSIYSKYEESVITTALKCCFDQYTDAQDALDKISGICHNKTTRYWEEGK